MAVLGTVLEQENELVLTRRRDFIFSFVHLDNDLEPSNFPSGSLYFEFSTDPMIVWHSTIVGTTATFNIESEDVDFLINSYLESGIRWQLVFLPTGEPAGGYPVALGSVTVQGK